MKPASYESLMDSILNRFFGLPHGLVASTLSQSDFDEVSGQLEFDLVTGRVRSGAEVELSANGLVTILQGVGKWLKEESKTSGLSYLSATFHVRIVEQGVSEMSRQRASQAQGGTQGDMMNMMEKRSRDVRPRAVPWVTFDCVVKLETATQSLEKSRHCERLMLVETNRFDS